jgi:hypothetical protein
VPKKFLSSLLNSSILLFKEPGKNVLTMNNKTTKPTDGKRSLKAVRKNKYRAVMLNIGPNGERCDATKADSSTLVWSIKIFLN